MMKVLGTNLFINYWSYQCRRVSTWSPLATAFNNRPSNTNMYARFNQNYRLQTGLFNRPELSSSEGFYVLRDQAREEVHKLVQEATSNPCRPMVDIFDELSDTVCKVADMAEFVRIAHPESSFAQAAEDVCNDISGLVESLNTHRGLYHALRNSVQTGTCGNEHLANLFSFDFEQSGIHLAEDQRQRVVALNDEILLMGQKFMANAAKPRKIPQDAVPANVRQFFNSDGQYLIVSGVYADCSDAAAREAAYRLYLAPEITQDTLLNATLEARKEMANICGFQCYADRAIRASTMETRDNVMQFLNKLSDHLYPRAEEEFDTMRALKSWETPYLNELMCWDTPYYTNKARLKLLNVDNSEFKPYFSLGACMDGLNMICQELYGINLVNEELSPGESWSADVYKLSVVDEKEGLLGYIYCDMYERPSKPHQDCHFTIQGGRLLPNGTYQNPIVVIMLSLTGGNRSCPALLAPSAVDNLFHEVGHALHSMLGRVRYQHVSGTRTATDLAEVPSVLMEYFACSPQVVRRFARHFQTQEPMPEDMLHRLCASKYLYSASEMQQQVFYSVLDQQYHGPLASCNGQTTRVLEQVQTQYYGLPYIENTAWQHRFSHLIGYGAKYYSYLISRAVSWSIWNKYFERNPLSREAGEGFRYGVLQHGGSIHPQHLLTTYLKTEISPESLATALADEMDYHQQQFDTVFQSIKY